MNDIENWTDKELIQVYDLQEKYAEKIVDFVRQEEESEVYKFLQIIPTLHSYDDFKVLEKELYRTSEFIAKISDKGMLKGNYIYKDLFGNWRGADTLREIFEKKYQWDFVEARPEVLALFAENNDTALKKYSADVYEHLRKEIPQTLKSAIKDLIMEYPKEIADKAVNIAIYGHTNAITNVALHQYSKEHIPEFEKLYRIIHQERVNTIIAAYDLQAGLKIYHPELQDRALTGAIKNFVSDKNSFEMIYGEKSSEILRQASEEEIKLASKYDFVSTKEKIPVIENHKVCLFGTTNQKIRISYKSDWRNIADKDFQIIVEEIAKKYEQEGFSRKYYPNRKGHKEYSKQSYKIVGRVKIENKLPPEWNIIFADGKIVTAQSDEIIATEINERIYGEQLEKFGKMPMSEVFITGAQEKLSLREGREKITAIIRQLQFNGESIDKLKDFLDEERKNLLKSNVR